MKLSHHHRKVEGRQRAHTVRVALKRAARVTANWVFLERTKTKWIITPQAIINHLTQEERKRLKAAGLVNPTVAQVIKTLWPIDAYAGMATFHQRTDGRYKT